MHPELIEKIMEEQEAKKLSFCRLTYDIDDDDVGKIIVKLPAEPHYIASRKFQGLVDGKKVAMGLWAELTAAGSSMFQGGNNNNCSKQGDETFMPTQPSPPPPGRRRSIWPALVVEVGSSESIDELRMDARWWLANSNGDVNVVILISLASDHQAAIDIETWRLVASPAATYS